MKIFFLFLSLLTLIEAREIKPVYKFKAVGFVNDFCISDDKIYIASDAGIVDVYDIKSKKLLEQIILKPLVTGQGTIVDSVISSVDVMNNKVLITSTTMSGYRNVWLYENHRLKLLVDESKKLTIKEARFTSDSKIMLSTLDADVILQDLDESYNVYRTHISNSIIGDYQLSTDKKSMAIADESGSVTIVNVSDSKVIKKPTPQNLDNIFHIAYANDTVLTAGQDMRVGVYPNFSKPYYIETDFLVYCVGLNPSASVGVYTSGEENVLQLFNPQTKKKLYRLIGHKGIVNQIKFTAEREFYSSDRSNNVYFWKF